MKKKLMILAAAAGMLLTLSIGAVAANAAYCPYGYDDCPGYGSHANGYCPNHSTDGAYQGGHHGGGHHGGGHHGRHH